jgi:hypothetical protein
MPKHIARITLTRAGGFPQELEVSEGTTIAIDDGIATVTKITSGSLTLRYAREGAAPVEGTAGEKPATLTVDKAPIASLALISITTQEETP